ncbi:MAG: HD domain-containing protein [Deltaproteobacteria bacterium]|nr:HD domain-containing protein [Deltaproteobacteria bacterium]
MLDLQPFENLFASISRITGLHLDVVHEGEFISAGAAAAKENVLAEELRQLSLQSCSQKNFQQRTIHDRFHLFAVPLTLNGEQIGSLAAHCAAEGQLGALLNSGATPAPCSAIVQETLNNLARHMEFWWTNQHESEEMAEQLAESFEELHLYSNITPQIEAAVMSQKKFQLLLTDLQDIMRVELVFSRFPTNPDLNVFAFRKQGQEAAVKQTAFIDALIGAIPSHTLAKRERYYIVNNSSLAPAYRDLHPSPFRFLAVTIQHGDNAYGWLGLVSFNMEEIFRRSELRLLISIAEQMGFVMKNSALFNELGQFVIDVVRSLVHTIEAKDVYTRGHSERVNQFSMLMAEQMNLSNEEKKFLHWASTLHDIGKIGIPEAILNKPASLSDDEYAAIKSHPETGFAILKPLRPLADSLPGILHHHERYDGTGYPKRLKGNQIPLIARIIAVADTFDAITSDRAYRKTRSTEEALAIITDVAGTQLDPELVSVFKDIPLKESASGGQNDTVPGGG